MRAAYSTLNMPLNSRTIHTLFQQSQLSIRPKKLVLIEVEAAIISKNDKPAWQALMPALIKKHDAVMLTDDEVPLVQQRLTQELACEELDRVLVLNQRQFSCQPVSTRQMILGLKDFAPFSQYPIDHTILVGKNQQGLNSAATLGVTPVDTKDVGYLQKLIELLNLPVELQPKSGEVKSCY